MENIIKKRVLKKFGVNQKGIYRGPVHEMFIEDIKDAIDENKFIALIGDFGSGKTSLFDFVEQDYSHNDRYHFVHVENTNKEKLTINNITDAIILDLTKETPQRSMEARTRQITRILGELHVNKRKNICVVIENAHRVHAATLMAVKDMREKKYLGRHPLFSIALIGQGELRNKLAKWDEVLWRTLILDLHNSEWMSYQERINYLNSVFGDSITGVAKDRIAMQTRTPLHMEFLLAEKMDEAAKAGKDVIDDEVFPATLRERYEALRQHGVSQKKIGELAGNLSKSSVSDTLAGKSKIHEESVRKAIQDLESEIRGDNSSRMAV